MDLFDVSYLAQGTARQRDAHRAILDLGILGDLAEFTPALAGTVPLDIGIEGSDLDIICSAQDLVAFAERVGELYGRHPGFRISGHVVRGVSSVVATFAYGGWGFELFGQPVPTARQFACLHLIAEARLLALGGKPARDAIRELKRQGMKTEPAFASYFGLIGGHEEDAGDCYEELARLADVDDQTLREAVRLVC
jgi:hypothetical protein